MKNINSIYTDLGIELGKKEAGDCQHTFTIRGCVVEMRNNDPELCSDFPSDSDKNKSKNQLEPLHVPRFKWWRCIKCQLDIVDTARALQSLSDLQEGSPNLNGEKSSSCSEKENNSSVGRAAVIGHDQRSLEDNAKEKTSSPTLDIVASVPCENTQTNGTGFVNEISEETPEINDSENHALAIDWPGPGSKGSSFVERVDILEKNTCEETLAVKNSHLKRPSGLRKRRKPRKYRLMSELMGLSEKEKKRKMPEAPAMERNCPINEAKKVRAVDQELGESTVERISISDSESEEDAFSKLLTGINELIARRADTLRQENYLSKVEDGSPSQHKELSGQAGTEPGLNNEQSQDPHNDKIQDFDLNKEALNEEDAEHFPIMQLQQHALIIGEFLECTLNRNPAEFSLPDDEMHTIGGEDPGNI